MHCTILKSKKWIGLLLQNTIFWHQEKWSHRCSARSRALQSWTLPPTLNHSTTTFTGPAPAHGLSILFYSFITRTVPQKEFCRKISVSISQENRQGPDDGWQRENTKYGVAFSCVSAFMCSMASCASACACVYACGGKRSTPAVFFSVYLTLTRFLNEPALIDWLPWLARNLQEAPCLYLLAQGLQAHTWLGFSGTGEERGFWIQNLGLAQQVLLSNEPSSQHNGAFQLGYQNTQTHSTG